MKTINSSNIKIPVEFIIEIGLYRKKSRCALCNNKMDVPRPNIQLCISCREKELHLYDTIKEKKPVQEFLDYEERGEN